MTPLEKNFLEKKKIHEPVGWLSVPESAIWVKVLRLEYACSVQWTSKTPVQVSEEKEMSQRQWKARHCRGCLPSTDWHWKSCSDKDTSQEESSIFAYLLQHYNRERKNKKTPKINQCCLIDLVKLWCSIICGH